MSNLIKLAKEYRLPLKSTQEDMELYWDTVIRYGNRILVAENYYMPDGKSWVGVVYEFRDDNETTCEDEIILRDISEERFEDNGHAIEWAIRNC